MTAGELRAALAQYDDDELVLLADDSWYHHVGSVEGQDDDEGRAALTIYPADPFSPNTDL